MILSRTWFIVKLKEGNSENFFKFCDDLVKNRLLSTDVYEVLVNTHCKLGEFVEVIPLLDSIGKQGLMLSFATCKTVVHGLYNSKYENEVARVLKSMVNFGWVPHSSSLADLISEHKKDLVSGDVRHVSEQVAY